MSLNNAIRFQCDGSNNHITSVLCCLVITMIRSAALTNSAVIITALPPIEYPCSAAIWHMIPSRSCPYGTSVPHDRISMSSRLVSWIIFLNMTSATAERLALPVHTNTIFIGADLFIKWICYIPAGLTFCFEQLTRREATMKNIPVHTTPVQLKCSQDKPATKVPTEPPRK